MWSEQALRHDNLVVISCTQYISPESYSESDNANTDAYYSVLHKYEKGDNKLMYYTAHPQTPDSPGNNIPHPLNIGPPPDTSLQSTVHHENSDPVILNAV